MEEKIEIWQVGNTGLRNPNRIQEGFKAFANSPYVGNPVSYTHLRAHET